MENIFEKAKFGDKFRTKDGRVAVLVKFRLDCACEMMRYVSLYVEEKDNLIGDGLINYQLDGTVQGNNNDDITIVEKVEK